MSTQIKDLIKLSKTIQIAAWGDSLTQSFIDINPWTNALEKLTGALVYNGGIGGQTASQVATRMIADTSKSTYSTIIWVGRNDVSNDYTIAQTAIVNNVANMVAALGHTRYLILGVTNKNNEPTGSNNLNTINTTNSALATTYGSKFIDIRAYLLTQGTGTGQDATDVGNGIIPTSLMRTSDTTHFNEAAYIKIANKILLSISQLTDSTQAGTFAGHGQIQHDLAKGGTYKIGAYPVLYLPAQDKFLGSIIVGDGGQLLSRTSGSEGQNNILIGIQTANALTIGNGNIAMGRFAMNAQTTGSDCIAIGSNALLSNVTNNKCVAIGTSALQTATGDNNTAVGYKAGFSNTTGNLNVSIGLFANYFVVNAIQNTAIGSYANFNGTGSGTTAVGYNSGYNLGTGNFNTLIGNSAGAGTGASNVSNVVAVGYQALQNIVTFANANIGIGTQAGLNITSGSNNIIIGYNISAPSATANNQLNIGNILFGQGITGSLATIAGTIGIGKFAATTAMLSLPAGTATVAPVNIASGVVLTTPLNGSLEYDGTNLFFTVGTTRKTVTLT